MEYTPETTVKQVKEYFSESMRNGKAVYCPCCNRLVKLYKRSITSSMAYGLILVEKYYGGYIHINPWFHLEEFFKKQNVTYSIRGDMPKWVYWGCLERAEDHKEDGNPENGMYRLTETGVNFVAKFIKLRKYVKIYNKVAYGFEGGMIDIVDALKNKFDYHELMAR